MIPSTIPIPLPGGLEVPNPAGDDAIVIANAAVLVHFDD